jgi:hypothetical protein
MEEIPCCAPTAARKVRRVQIGDSDIGVISLDEIKDGVKALGLREGSKSGRNYSSASVSTITFLPRSIRHTRYSYRTNTNGG